MLRLEVSSRMKLISRLGGEVSSYGGRGIFKKGYIGFLWDYGKDLGLCFVNFI